MFAQVSSSKPANTAYSTSVLENASQSYFTGLLTMRR